MEATPKLPDDPCVMESPYAGLGGFELVAAIHRDGRKGVELARGIKSDYIESICMKAGVKYPDEFLESDVGEIWNKRCRTVGAPLRN